MTTIRVSRVRGSIVRVECQGHTGFGAEGEDIVCAALSSIVQTALLGVMQVAGIPVDYSRDDALGFLDFSLPRLLGEDRHNASMILDTMLCGVADLAEEYSDYVNLIVIDD